MKYEITRHGSDYVLWKNVETEHGVGCFKIVSGTKEECKQKLEELNGTGTRKTKELDGNNRLLLEKIKQLRKEIKNKDEIIKERERIIAELRYKQQKLF